VYEIKNIEFYYRLCLPFEQMSEFTIVVLCQAMRFRI